MSLLHIVKIKDTRRAFVHLCLLVLVFTLFACATANTGGVKHSREVAQAFETYHVNPEFHYYHYNQENNPYAVVGLLKAYTIKDPDWRPVDPDSATYTKVIDLVKSFPEYYSYPYGSHIINPQGEPIGMWYSSLPPPGITVDPESKRVSINAARPWLDDDRGWWRGPGGTGIGIGIGTGGSGIGIHRRW